MNATPHTSFRHYGSLVQSGCDASRESDLMKWNERKQQQLQRHNTKSIDCMHEPQNNYEVKEQKKNKNKNLKQNNIYTLKRATHTCFKRSNRERNELASRWNIIIIIILHFVFHHHRILIFSMH